MKNNLQELRKEGKISQSDLAEQVGVTRQTIKVNYTINVKLS